MTETSFLAGKVTKRVLPVVAPGGGPEAPRLKRLLLPQGELAQFYDGDVGLRYLAFIELRADGVRGQHYHERKEELIYVIDGEVLLVVEDRGTKMRESVRLEAGDLAVIEPGVAHAMRTVRPGRAIEGSPTRFEPGDVYRYPLE